MKKFLLASFFCAFLFINLFFKKNIYAQEIIYGTDRIITRAEVAKMISFIYGNKKDILACYKNREINFLDSKINNWFDKYINFVFEKKIMTGTSENKFEPEKYLNLNQAQILLDKINVDNKIKIKMDDENKNKFVSYSLWVKLFLDLLSDLEIKNIKQQEIIVLATHEQNKKDILKNFLVSDKNYFCCEGINFDFYEKKVKVLVCEQEILAIINYDYDFNVEFKINKKTGNKIWVENDLLKRCFYLKKDLQGKKINVNKNYVLKIKSGEIIDFVESNNFDERKEN